MFRRFSTKPSIQTFTTALSTRAPIPQLLSIYKALPKATISPKLYTTFISTLLRQSHTFPIPSIFQDLENHQLVRQPHKLLLLKYYLLLRKIDQAKEVLVQLTDDYLITAQSEILRYYVSRDMIQTAELFFKSMKPSTAEPFIVMLNYFIQHVMPYKADDLIEMIHQSRIKMNSPLYTAIIKHHCMQHREALAAQLLEEYAAQGLTSIGPYTQVLHAYAKSASKERALEIYNRIVSAGFPIDIGVLNNLVFAHRYELEQVDKVMELIQSKQVEPNEKTFTYWITACAIAGDFEKMEKVFEKVKEEKRLVTIEPYQVILRAYADIGDMNKAEQVVERCVKDGIGLHADLCNQLMYFYGLERDADKAWDLFKKLKAEGKPNSRTYYSLIQAFGHCAGKEPPKDFNNWTEALNFFEDFLNVPYLLNGLVQVHLKMETGKAHKYYKLARKQIERMPRGLVQRAAVLSCTSVEQLAQLSNLVESQQVKEAKAVVMFSLGKELAKVDRDRIESLKWEFEGCRKVEEMVEKALSEF